MKGQMSKEKPMLRVNNFLLSYIEDIYSSESNKEVTLKMYSKGERVYTQGQFCSTVSIMKKGFVKCFYNENNDKDFIFEFLSSGEIIGEIEAIKNIHCLCNIEAVSEIEIYTFSTRFFLSLIEKNPEFRNQILLELSERLINTSYRASFQTAYSAKYGLLRLLNMQKKQNITLSKFDMASYLGIDIRSLNRILKEIEKNTTTFP